MRLFCAFLPLFALSACSGDGESVTGVAAGKTVFEVNCLSCHGKEARGLTDNWKVKGVNGEYPAPPLNGSAHTWHHSPAQLLTIITEGGIKIGGQMPPFEHVLTDGERQAVLDYIMSLWSLELKAQYDERFN